jgi:hypothetical protein
MGRKMLLPIPSNFLMWAVSLRMSLVRVVRMASCNHSVMSCFHSGERRSSERCVRRWFEIVLCLLLVKWVSDMGRLLRME